MSELKEQSITRETIINYVKDMKLVKSSFGGVDKENVYHHIQEIVKLCSEYIDTALAEKDDEMQACMDEKEQQIHKLNDSLSEMTNKVKQYQNMRSKEAAEHKRELDALKDELNKLRENENRASAEEKKECVKLMEEQKVKNEELLSELNELRESLVIKDNQINTLQERIDKKIEESSVDAGLDIEDILSDARMEAGKIIDNAKIEAEQEMVKLLKLRLQYKQQKESSKLWCKQVNDEKEEMLKFIAELSERFENLEGELDQIKADINDFNTTQMREVLKSEE